MYHKYYNNGIFLGLLLTCMLFASLDFCEGKEIYKIIINIKQYFLKIISNERAET